MQLTVFRPDSNFVQKASLIVVSQLQPIGYHCFKHRSCNCSGLLVLLVRYNSQGVAVTVQQQRSEAHATIKNIV